MRLLVTAQTLDAARGAAVALIARLRESDPDLVRSREPILPPVVTFMAREGDRIEAPPPPATSIELETDGIDPRRLAETLHSLAGPAKIQTDTQLGAAFYAPGTPFGTLHEATTLIAKAPPRPGAGKPVHVVIVDQGFDHNQVAPPFGGGWFTPSSPLPGQGHSRHAAMIARAVRAMAPGAILFDAPLIPTPAPGALPTINDIPTFTLNALAWWTAFETHIAGSAGAASWVFVNAWAIYDRASELPFVTAYSTDPDHVLNQAIDGLVRDNLADTVFAAGNCGQFEPDQRCGRNDRGPGRSIFGGNSLASTLTASAVRTDRSWLGFSSQGPGQAQLGPDKPDLCAPAGFADDDDAAFLFGGTSAAAALAAGAVATLRAQVDQATLPPIKLLPILRATVLLHEPNQPKERIGAGLLQLQAAQNAV